MWLPVPGRARRGAQGFTLGRGHREAVSRRSEVRAVRSTDRRMNRQANEISKQLYRRGLYAVQPYPQRAYARSALGDSVSLQPRGGHRGGAGWCGCCTCGTGTSTGTWTTTTMLQGNGICCVSNTSPLPQLARCLSFCRLWFLTSRHTTCLATSLTSILSSHFDLSHLISHNTRILYHPRSITTALPHHYTTPQTHRTATSHTPAHKGTTRPIVEQAASRAEGRETRRAAKAEGAGKAASSARASSRPRLHPRMRSVRW
jgi:hypothetical protein